jgi:hypothetical protein
MPKLKLSLEELAVTSFEPEPTPAAAALVPSHNTACETCRTLCLPYC